MNMGYARTQEGACRRVIMKRALRRKGLKINPTINTKLLEQKYRKHIKKAPPTYKEVKGKCRIYREKYSAKL